MRNEQVLMVQGERTAGEGARGAVHGFAIAFVGVGGDVRLGDLPYLAG